MARMDSNRTAEDFFKAHPDWFARDGNGQPYRAADKYVTCINSPYYDEYLPGVLREIIERSHPDGFTDNSWAGHGPREHLLLRQLHAQVPGEDRQGAAATGRLGRPGVPRVDHVELRAAHRGLGAEQPRRRAPPAGPDCIWSGMNSGSVTAQARSFRDLKEICARADIMMLDHQRRDDDTGFQQNGDTGKRVHIAARLGQAGAGEHGDVPVGSGLLPRREQAGGGGAHVDDRGHRRRHSAVVASRRRLPRGPPHVPHRRAGHAMVQGERAISGQSHAGRQRRGRVVAAQHRFLRPR